jgi:hypothetical protein
MEKAKPKFRKWSENLNLDFNENDLREIRMKKYSADES